MRHMTHDSAALLLLLVASTAGAAWAGAADPAEVDERIRRVENGLSMQYVVEGYDESASTYNIYERMEHYSVPGVSIAVINNGRIEWAKGYGLADVAAGRGVDTETLFQVASIGKPVTTAGALRLVEQGMLVLDRDVNVYLSSWKLPGNEFTQDVPVTLELLLSHTGGTTVHGFPGYPDGSDLPTLKQILDGLPPSNTPAVRVDIVPGTEWRYSGGGFLIVQQMMEDLLGRPFEDAMSDLVFEPAGMQRTFYFPRLPAHLEENAAYGYLGDGSPVEGDYHLYPEYGAGAGLWSTPSDLARFAIEIQNSYAGRPGSLLEAETARDMMASRKGSYGLGFAVASESGEVVFSHSGGNAGYRNQLIAYARTGKGAVIMTNSDAGREVYHEIVRAIAAAYAWPDYASVRRVAADLSPDQLNALAGQYDFPGLGPVPLWIENGHLYGADPLRDGAKVLLLPESPTEFFAPVAGWEMFFEVDEAGAATAVSALIEGMELRGTRIR
jgi:CubicO group peptidase (beta-lactamase class C family)